MVIIEVEGVDGVLRNLSNWKGRLGIKAVIGMKKAASMIMRESLKIVPVQTGFLKASWDTRQKGSGLNASIIMGYFGVYYGAYVHEIPNPPHAHGHEFNVKHLDEIARAGMWSSNLRTHRATFKPYGRMGTAQGGMFPRKPNEQFKFLERPIREHHADILRIIRGAVK